MSRTPDKNAIVRKMFDEGDPDDLLIDTERSTKRVTIRDEASVSLIKRRSPAQFIPLSSIVKRSAAQIRLTDFDPEKYPEDKCLLESIRNRGVVTPVMVKEFIEDDDDLLADSKYELIYGHRRVSACKVLGFTTIPAFVVDSTVKAADVTMTENIGVRTLNAYERGREFDNYLVEHNISMRSLAEINGFSHGYVSMLIDAYRASRKSLEIEALFQDGQLYFRDVPELADLYEKADGPSRELLIEMLPELSRKQTADLIALCAAGGTASGYLKSLAASSSVVPNDVPNKDKESENTNPESELKTESVPELEDLWNALQSDKKYVKRQASVYECSESDVMEAANVCQVGNALPDILPCMLLIRKNGGEITNKTLKSVMCIADNRNAAKALSLYISAYEKMNERRSACRKRLESLIAETDDDHDILSKLFGAGK